MKNGNIILGLGVLIAGYFVWKNNETKSDEPYTDEELDKKINKFADKILAISNKLDKNNQSNTSKEHIVNSVNQIISQRKINGLEISKKTIDEFLEAWISSANKATNSSELGGGMDLMNVVNKFRGVNNEGETPAETKQKSQDFINALNDFTIIQSVQDGIINGVTLHYYKQNDEGYLESHSTSTNAKFMPPKPRVISDQEYVKAFKKFEEQQKGGTSKIVDIPIVAPIKTPNSIIKDIIYDTANYNPTFLKIPVIGATINGEKYYKKDGKYYKDALQFGGAERFRPMEITQQQWLEEVISQLPI